MFGFVELVAAYINAIVLKSFAEEFFGLWRWGRVATESRICVCIYIHIYTYTEANTFVFVYAVLYLFDTY